MSDKATCPACDVHLSSIWQVPYGVPDDEDACPSCGLSGRAMRELVEAKERGANEGLVERAAQAERRADVAERRVRRLEAALDEVLRTAERARDAKPEGD